MLFVFDLPPHTLIFIFLPCIFVFDVCLIECLNINLKREILQAAWSLCNLKLDVEWILWFLNLVQNGKLILGDVCIDNKGTKLHKLLFKRCSIPCLTRFWSRTGLIWLLKTTKKPYILTIISHFLNCLISWLLRRAMMRINFFSSSKLEIWIWKKMYWKMCTLNCLLHQAGEPDLDQAGLAFRRTEGSLFSGWAWSAPMFSQKSM